MFEATVLGRHAARYHRDPTVDVVFVDAPHWLDEAYSDELPMLDTGVVDRNILFADKLARLLGDPRNAHLTGNGVDLGGGYGLFVRAMRDRGYDFRWSDPFTRNIFAKGFEAADEPYDVATLFEVIEHLPDPVPFLKEAVQRYAPKCIFISTEVYAEGHPPDRDWGYYAFETGQHICIYTRKALEFVAEQIGYRLISIDGWLFCFTRVDVFEPAPPSPLLQMWRRWRRGVDKRLEPRPLKRQSLTQADQEKARRAILERRQR